MRIPAIADLAAAYGHPSVVDAARVVLSRFARKLPPDS